MENKNINTNGTDGKPPVVEPTSPTKVQQLKEKEKPDKGGDSDSERLEMIVILIRFFVLPNLFQRKN